MILRLEIPMTNPSLTGGVLKEWHKDEGDRIGFGEDLCTVSFDEFAVLRRTARATLLAGRKNKNLKSQLESRDGKVLLHVVVSSAEPGTLEKILLAPGDRFAVTDTIGVVSTSPTDGQLNPEDWNDSPTMRVAANTSADTELV